MADEVANAKILAARSLINTTRMSGTLERIQDAEFKVFSQFGDDGIVQYLIQSARVEGTETRFVEFGVENYEEANTRFLLLNNNWSGLVIDSDPGNIRYIKSDRIFWRHDLTALCAFIDAENIDELISSAGFSMDLGLLSIDLDGIDYWIWKNISCVEPVIVVVEYNSVFGPDHRVSVPYDRRFRRASAHYSHLYWGCSIGALELLGREKGYALVGSNSAGNNAYFVRRDRLGSLSELSAKEAYVASRFRESRDKSGRLTFLAGSERIRAIRDMPLLLLESDKVVRIAELYRC